jgi:dihydropteroate synthase
VLQEFHRTDFMRLVDRPGKGLVMGVLNVTPDSFSDGGRFDSLPRAVKHAVRMVDEGADILDIGGESTRPGAEPVSADEELARVIPVVEKLCEQFELPISIDTSKAVVMREAVAAGASMINDVRALRGDGALAAAAELRVPICLMHMLGEPQTMQQAPAYEDVIANISSFLYQRVEVCTGAGIEKKNIILDPGFGFGKTLEHNLQLLRNLDKFVGMGFPVLVGMSRKSIIGQLLDRPVEDRVHGGLALALLARQQGASIFRTHDVAPTVDALKILEAV